MTAMTRKFAGVAAAAALAVVLALSPALRAAPPVDDQSTAPQIMDHGGMPMTDHARPGHDPN